MKLWTATRNGRLPSAVVSLSWTTSHIASQATCARFRILQHQHLQGATELVMSHKQLEQEVKVIWQKAPHGGPIPRLGVTPGGRKLYHWIPGVGFPISVP